VTVSDGARPSAPDGGLLRELGLLDTIALVVGCVIGSGVFLVPADIARSVHTEGWMLSVWVAGGVASLLGVLSLAELGAAIPAAGGLYTFIARAYGPLAGFLCGWMLFTVSTSGSAATLAVALSISLADLFPIAPSAGSAISIVAILVLTAINVLGVRSGAFVQNVLTFVKVGGLVGMIVLIFFAPGVPPGAEPPLVRAGPMGLAAIGAAVVAVLWAYEGWHFVSFAAGEIRDPQRIFPRGSIAGMAIVTLLYLVANLAYLHVLTPAEMASSERVAATAIRKAVGDWGGRALTAVIVASILGALNAIVLAGPRAYYQMAKDGLFPRPFAAVHPKWRTPAAAILLQGIWSCLLILVIGGFSQLFTYVVFGGFLFYALGVAAVIVLRRREPDLPRPFRVPAYPVVPLLFVGAALALIANTLATKPRESLLGIGFILLGVPIYALLSRTGYASGRGTTPP